ncbi:MAG: helix-turn-helix domain-containing protein [Solirubrobacteraceae bacterium]
MERESLRLLLAQGLSVEKIARRFGKHPSTVSYWMAKHGLVSPNRDKHISRGEIERETLAALIAQGMSITELAAELDRSKATVRHWLKRYGLQTLQTRRRAERRAALLVAEASSAEPAQRLTMTCRLHGDTEFVREGSGYYRCGRCRSESVMRHRRRLKELLVEEAGGQCILCGYHGPPRALEFHHIDRAEKGFALSRKGSTLSVQALRAEAKKCVLLCSNCHAEVEDGVVALPDRVREGSSGHSCVDAEVPTNHNPG